jgi:hypothetical protein
MLEGSLDRDQARWDEQLDADAAAGRLDLPLTEEPAVVWPPQCDDPRLIEGR